MSVSPSSFPSVTEDDVFRLAVRSHLAGIVASIAVFAAVLPYTYLTDCRANYPSREIVGVVSQTIGLFFIGLSAAVFPRLLFCMEVATTLTGRVLQRPALAFWEHLEQDKVRAIPRRVARTAAAGWRRTRDSAIGRISAAVLRVLAPLHQPLLRWFALRLPPLLRATVDVSEWMWTHMTGVSAIASFCLFLYTAGILFNGTVAVFSVDALPKQQQTYTSMCAEAQGHRVDPKTANPWSPTTPFEEKPWGPLGPPEKHAQPR